MIAAYIEFYGEFKLKPLYTKSDYDNFLKFLDREYDGGFGGQVLHGIIFCENDTWFDRGEYDGSEWWEIHTYPSLLNHFSKSDVVKYDRKKKLDQLNSSSSL